MSRALAAAVLAVSLATPALADVTVKQTTTGKGLGMSGSMSGTTYIKGSKMRTDTVTGDTVRSVIFDIDAQKMYAFDSRKKEAEVTDMAVVAADVAKATDLQNMKASVEPNGQSKEIAGKSAAGYDVAVSLPAMLGGPGGMAMTVALTGPMWIVKDVPGAKEWASFYGQAAEKGWIFTDPRAAKGSPGQARSMTEMYRKMAETGGIAYETSISIKVDGSGPMAGLMAKMGGMQSTTTVSDVSNAPLADDLFAVPAGYKLKERK